MERIMVPLDGSAFAETALPLALDLARAARAELHFVLVHEFRVPLLEPRTWGAYREELAGTAHAEDAAYLNGVADRCTAERGVRIRTDTIEGPVATALSRYAREAAIDLIVMTTHGRGGISRAWIGSVADALIRRSAVPLLLLRPSAIENAPRLELLKRVVLPLDGSALAEQAIGPARALAKLCGARFTLLHALLPLQRPGPNDLRAGVAEAMRYEREQARTYLGSVAGELHEAGIDADIAVRTHAYAPQAILDETRAAPGTCVVMATHGRAGWARIAIGSVADKVLRAADVPVLLYRPAMAADDRALDGAAQETAGSRAS